MSSVLKVSEIQDPTNSNSAIEVDSTGSVSLPNTSGGILQVKSTLWQARSSKSYTAATTTVVDELAVTITPRDANSKFLIMVRASGEVNGGNEHDTIYGIDRNGTNINTGTYGTMNSRGLAMIQISYHADDSDSTPSTTCYQTVDSPATTSSITYKVNIWQLQGYGKIWNSTVNSSTTNTSNEQCSSEIIVMEIGG